MDILFIILALIAIVLFFVLIYAWSLYNNLVKKRNQVKTDLSDINIQLKRKVSLVDRLVSMVKEYATHEKSTFKEVAQARSAIESAKSAKDSAKAENMLTETLKSVMLVVEDYPKLQASKNYTELRVDLKEIEDSVARYREEYNIAVQKYNNTVQTFPNVLFTSVLGFKEEPLFQPE